MFYSCVSVTTCSSNNILPIAWFFCNFFVFMAWQPLVGHGPLIAEASWSHWVRHTTLGRISLDEWSAQCRDISTKQHTTFTRDGHACPLQVLKPHSQQLSSQLFDSTEFISDRELVNGMIPDAVLPDDEDSEPFWSLVTCLLLLWSCCLCFLILWRSAQTTSGTESALAPERPQLRNFQYMFTALLCRQVAIKLFTQLHTHTTFAVPNEFLHNFTFSQAGNFKCHTVMIGRWQCMQRSNGFWTELNSSQQQLPTKYF